jgi:hypothetical protein
MKAKDSVSRTAETSLFLYLCHFITRLRSRYGTFGDVHRTDIGRSSHVAFALLPTVQVFCVSWQMCAAFSRLNSIVLDCCV